MNNQKQIALAVAMYAQEMEDRLPTSKTWVTDLSSAGYLSAAKLLDCPSMTGKGEMASDKPEYGYGWWLDGKVLADLTQPASIILTADATTSVLGNSHRLGVRHAAGNIYSFIDGHVAYFAKGKLTNFYADNFEDGDALIQAPSLTATSQLPGVEFGNWCSTKNIWNAGWTITASIQPVATTDNANNHGLVVDFVHASSASWGDISLMLDHNKEVSTSGIYFRGEIIANGTTNDYTIGLSGIDATNIIDMRWRPLISNSLYTFYYYYDQAGTRLNTTPAIASNLTVGGTYRFEYYAAGEPSEKRTATYSRVDVPNGGTWRHTTIGRKGMTPSAVVLSSPRGNTGYYDNIVIWW